VDDEDVEEEKEDSRVLTAAFAEACLSCTSSSLILVHVFKFCLQTLPYMLSSGTTFSVNWSRGFANVVIKNICDSASLSGSSEDMTVCCSRNSSSRSAWAVHSCIRAFAQCLET
jgi:hypothetical protein